MKVVILGAGGQLARDLIDVMSDWNLVKLTHSDLDISNSNQVFKILSEEKPNIVINTAAFHRVDDCEDQVQKSFEVNTYAVRELAKICSELDITLVHISTDYVFGGDKREPYKEDDLPNPLNVYGVSKVAGEYFVKNICKKYFIVRSSGLYGVAGSSGKGGNFVETMIRLAREGKPIRVVNDQVLTPTYTKDLAEKIKELVKTENYGLYHITSGGECSWYEFAAKIFEYLNLTPDFKPISSNEFPSKARRPSYSVLSHEKLVRVGISDLRVWQEALKEYLISKGHIKS